MTVKTGGLKFSPVWAQNPKKEVTLKILLLAMPDAANNFHRIIKVPNLGLCSIAAHLTEHEVRIVDLVLVHKNIRVWLKEYLTKFCPGLIGISSMSFQYAGKWSIPGAGNISILFERLRLQYI